MSIIDNLLNRALDNIGLTKEQISKVKHIIDCIDIKEYTDHVEISLNLKHVKIKIEK